MTITEKILCFYTHKLFPRFSTPTFSRFSNLFYELSNNDSESNLGELINIYSEKLKNDSNIDKYIIYPERILNGTEKRTSIIIKGIPSAFGINNFYELLTKYCKEIHFFYTPGFAISKWKYIYAFVTIGRRKGVVNIFEGLTMIRDKYKTYKGFDFSKIEIYFCKYLNIHSLINKYKNAVNKINIKICK